MNTAENELRELLTAFTEGRIPDELGGAKCSTILYNLSEETASIAAKLARSVQNGHRKGSNRQVLFKSEDLPLLP